LDDGKEFVGYKRIVINSIQEVIFAIIILFGDDLEKVYTVSIT
jgi:hypothetical protein